MKPPPKPAATIPFAKAAALLTSITLGVLGSCVDQSATTGDGGASPSAQGDGSPDGGVGHAGDGSSGGGKSSGSGSSSSGAVAGSSSGDAAGSSGATGAEASTSPNDGGSDSPTGNGSSGGPPLSCGSDSGGRVDYFDGGFDGGDGGGCTSTWGMGSCQADCSCPAGTCHCSAYGVGSTKLIDDRVVPFAGCPMCPAVSAPFGVCGYR